MAALVRRLAAEAGVTAPVQTPPGCVARLLGTPDRRAILIALNLRDETVEAGLTVGAARPGELATWSPASR